MCICPASWEVRQCLHKCAGSDIIYRLNSFSLVIFVCSQEFLIWASFICVIVSLCLSLRVELCNWFNNFSSCILSSLVASSLWLALEHVIFTGSLIFLVIQEFGLPMLVILPGICCKWSVCLISVRTSWQSP